MNNRQRCKTDMYRLLKAYLESIAPAIYLLMPHFTSYLESWKNTVFQLYLAIDEQNRNRSGYAASKARVRLRFIDAISDYSAILMSYATYTDNQILFNLANYKGAFLRRVSDEVLISISQIIESLLRENLAQLGEYGVTGASIVEFHDLNQTFIDAKPMPKDQIYNKKESTAAIKALFKTADVTLKKMDGCVRLIMRIRGLFYREYFLRRKLQEPPIKTLAGRGKVTDAQGAAMPFVRMTSESLNIDRMVSIKGGFTIPDATEGFHDINFAYPGFQTTTCSVCFYPNIRAEIKVIMEVV